MGLFGRKQPPQGPPPQPMYPPGSLAWLNGKRDPLEGMVRNYSYGRRWAEPPRQTILGVFHDPRDGHHYFRRSTPGLATLTIAPPQSTKTTGILAPQVNTHHGPVVVMSTKVDLAHLTAIVRSRFGPVFHLDATGLDPIRGMIPVHISPVALSSTPARAKRIANMVATCGTSGIIRDPKGGFWSKEGGRMLQAPLYVANRLGYDEGFVFRALHALPSALDELRDFLENDPAGGDLLESWDALMATHHEGLSSIKMSASHALELFDSAEVRNRTGKFPFPFESFVRGVPDGENNLRCEGDDFDRDMEAMGKFPIAVTGRYPTVFITSNSMDAEESQLIYRMFLRLLWETTQEVHRSDKAAGITYRRPTLLVIDELANIAPDPLYPSLVSQSGDQGLLVSSVVQDLSLLEKNFGTEAKAFLTIHGHRLAFPGISNAETLRAISDIFGSRWEERFTTSDSVTQSEHPSTGYGSSQTDHRVPNLDPGQIHDGKPGDPKAILHWDNSPGYEYLWPSPVWAARPWPRIMVNAMIEQLPEVMVAPDNQTWPVWMLPIPELDRRNPRTGQFILIESHGTEEGTLLLNGYNNVKESYARFRDAA